MRENGFVGLQEQSFFLRGNVGVKSLVVRLVWMDEKRVLWLMEKRYFVCWEILVDDTFGCECWLTRCL